MSHSTWLLKGSSKPSLVLVVLAAVFSAMVVLLIMISPLIGLGVLALGLVTLFTVLKPMTAALIFGFLTAAFPKAGIKVGVFPFPIFLFGLLVAVILVVIKTPRRNHSGPVTALVLVYLAWVFSRAFLFAEYSLGASFAFAAWSAIPVVLLYLSTMVDGDVTSFRNSIFAGFLLSCAYALVQFAGGVQTTAVPGLTYAFGDDITGKNNVIYVQGVADYSKIFSTYQNGNIYGLVAAGFFAICMYRVSRRVHTRLDLAVVGGSVIAVALSGSRTAIVAASLALVTIILLRGSLARKIWLLIVVGLAGAGVVSVQPGLLDRYSLEDVSSTGGAGRSYMWDVAASSMRPLEFVFGTANYRLTEGWLGIIMQYGVIGMALLVWIIVLLLKRRRAMWLPVGVLAIGAILDSSYQLFPTWFIFAALAAYEEPPMSNNRGPDSKLPRGIGTRLNSAPTSSPRSVAT